MCAIFTYSPDAPPRDRIGELVRIVAAPTLDDYVAAIIAANEPARQLNEATEAAEEAVSRRRSTRPGCVVAVQDTTRSARGDGISIRYEYVLDDKDILAPVQHAQDALTDATQRHDAGCDCPLCRAAGLVARAAALLAAPWHA